MDLVTLHQYHIYMSSAQHKWEFYSQLTLYVLLLIRTKSIEVVPKVQSVFKCGEERLKSRLNGFAKVWILSCDKFKMCNTIKPNLSYQILALKMTGM